jgi:hypothetical protein
MIVQYSQAPAFHTSKQRLAEACPHTNASCNGRPQHAAATSPPTNESAAPISPPNFVGLTVLTMWKQSPSLVTEPKAVINTMVGTAVLLCTQACIKGGTALGGLDSRQWSKRVDIPLPES